MLDMIKSLEIPVVSAHDPVKNPQSFMQDIKALEGSEGVIVVWSDGHRVKIKGNWYITRHKAKDKILRENGVIELLLDEKLDDIKPNLPSDDRHRLEEFERDFWRGVSYTSQTWRDLNHFCRRLHGDDRKGFALADGTKDMDQHLRAAIFKAWDNPDLDWRAAVVDVIRKNLGTQTKVDSVRQLFGARWSYGNDIGDE